MQQICFAACCNMSQWPPKPVNRSSLWSVFDPRFLPLAGQRGARQHLAMAQQAQALCTSAIHACRCQASGLHHTQVVTMQHSRIKVPFVGETEAHAAFQPWPVPGKPPMPELPPRRTVPFAGT